MGTKRNFTCNSTPNKRDICAKHTEARSWRRKAEYSAKAATMLNVIFDAQRRHHHHHVWNVPRIPFRLRHFIVPKLSLRCRGELLYCMHGVFSYFPICVKPWHLQDQFKVWWMDRWKKAGIRAVSHVSRGGREGSEWGLPPVEPVRTRASAAILRSEFLAKCYLPFYIR